MLAGPYCRMPNLSNRIHPSGTLNGFEETPWARGLVLDWLKQRRATGGLDPTLLPACLGSISLESDLLNGKARGSPLAASNPTSSSVGYLGASWRLGIPASAFGFQIRPGSLPSPSLSVTLDLRGSARSGGKRGCLLSV